MNQIYVGADHRGYRLKEIIINQLREEGYSVEDTGNSQYNIEDDFTDFAIKTAEMVIRGGARGILICGSGLGMSIIANKVKGIRAGLCTSIKQARLGRNDLDINLLCLSADLVSDEKNLKIVQKFLETVFAPEERYLRRIKKITQYESEKC
ncbi:MAG TPA: RpiB/LacA/LacB family sugar-phosphate isomerase [Candidatus Woesebacteria bacterium]|nr:RpiB/LacA/LacB family sugar-phosphate isomerase [Candidatus Woesebacteria bacterium]